MPISWVHSWVTRRALEHKFDCPDLPHRLIGIYFPDSFAHGIGEAQGLDARARNDGGEYTGRLTVTGVHLRRLLIAQKSLCRIPDDADDRPRRVSLDDFRWLANGVFVRPEAIGHRLVDQINQRHVGAIAVVVR